MRSSSKQIKMKGKEAIVIECCKLKTGSSLPGLCCKWRNRKLMHSVLQKISIDNIANKRKVPISIVKNNIRTLICFSLLRSLIRCLSGSRSPRYSHSRHWYQGQCIDWNWLNENIWHKLEFWLQIDWSSWGAHEYKIIADNVQKQSSRGVL